MSATHCAIPSCFWSHSKSKKTGEKRCLFTVRRPDLAKSAEEKSHRTALTRILLSMRDFSRGDKIREMLHKESAAICDLHFLSHDVITSGGKHMLRLGARPCLHLPMAMHPTTSRKALTEHEIPLKKVKHQSVDDMIRHYRNFLAPEPGLNEVAISEIERIMLKYKSLPAYITLDEMKTKENLVRSGRLNEFDESDPTADCQLASYILVFCLRTIQHEISLPLAWYPTRVTTPGKLSLYFWDLLYECESRGIEIHTVVVDGKSTNLCFFKMISNNSTIPLQGPFTAPNPYATKRPIFLCLDPFHLLKTVRNSLFSSKPDGERLMNMDSKDILWTHIRQLYNMEKASLVSTKLTESHIELNPQSKMKVGLAKDVLSWKVGQCLKTIPGAQGTSAFVLMMDRWFDIANCSTKCPIRTMEDERLAWLQQFADKLLAWKTDAEKLGQPKRIMALETIEGLVFTSHSFIALCERLLKRLPYVCLHSFTQDVIEVFGNLVTTTG